MNITFGICIGPNYDKVMFFNLIKSIYDEFFYKKGIFEILLIGQNITFPAHEFMRIIDFDESIKPGWITKKKNILAKEAQYDNLCILHDYYKLDKGWFEGIKKFDSENEDWMVSLNRVNNLEGTRHADWVVNPNRMLDLIKLNPEKFTKLLMDVAPHENGPQFVAGLPYDVTNLSSIQYISGGYFVCKSNLLYRIPMDENLTWGQGEDVAWSEDLNRHGVDFHFNPYSSVSIQKPNKWVMSQMPDEFVDYLRLYYLKREELYAAGK